MEVGVERGRSNGISEGFPFRSRDLDGFSASSASLSPPPHPSRTPSPSGIGSIEHRVSKLDTLAGIAIKYGVEVADIKRMNGLVTDLQMFAHKKLQIPSPGRHPPSPVLSNGSAANGEETPPSICRSNMFDSFHSLRLTTPPPRRVSTAMSNLQGYYGLTPARSKSSEEGTEMSVYRVGDACEIDYSTPPQVASSLYLLSNQNHKPIGSSQDDIDGGIADARTGQRSEPDKFQGEKMVGRQQRADAAPRAPTSGLLIKEENTGSTSVRNGKGLALRPKSGSRTDLVSAANGITAVRKSSSTPNLEDSDTSSLWPTSRWMLKTDAITRPLLEGLPRPIAFRKNKAARD